MNDNAKEQVRPTSPLDRLVRRPAKTWGDVYRSWLRKGHDHGSAAHEADKWADKQRK